MFGRRTRVDLCFVQSEWCSQAQDQCCGVICPNAPFTGAPRFCPSSPCRKLTSLLPLAGPGTILVFTVGTFVSLLQMPVASEG